MKQRVKPERYLVKAVINLAEIGTEKVEAVMLPANAEILGVNVEVLEATAANKTLKVGLNNEDSHFLNDIALDAAKKNFQSKVVTMTNDNSVVTAQANATCAKGKIALRVDYVLPTEIMTEF